MTSAHLICRDCQLHLHLGKLRYSADERRIGFTHGKYSPIELAALIEGFLAEHLEHRVEAYAEHDFDKQDWSAYTSLRPMPTVTAAIANTNKVLVGTILVSAEPHDGPPNWLRET